MCYDIILLCYVAKIQINKFIEVYALWWVHLNQLKYTFWKHELELGSLEYFLQESIKWYDNAVCAQQTKLFGRLNAPLILFFFSIWSFYLKNIQIGNAACGNFVQIFEFLVTLRHFLPLTTNRNQQVSPFNHIIFCKLNSCLYLRYGQCF